MFRFVAFESVLCNEPEQWNSVRETKDEKNPHKQQLNSWKFHLFIWLAAHEKKNENETSTSKKILTYALETFTDRHRMERYGSSACDEICTRFARTSSTHAHQNSQ